MLASFPSWLLRTISAEAWLLKQPPGNFPGFIFQCRGHRFDPWSRKIPHATEQLSPCATAIEPVGHNYWGCKLSGLRATTTKPMCCSYWSPRALELYAAPTEPTQCDYWSLRAYSLCSATWEATAIGSPCTTKSSLPFAATRESPCTAMKIQCNQKIN